MPFYLQFSWGTLLPCGCEKGLWCTTDDFLPLRKILFIRETQLGPREVKSLLIMHLYPSGEHDDGMVSGVRMRGYNR